MPPLSSERHTIRVGNTTLEIYRRTTPGRGEQWRFPYKLPGSERWRYGTYSTLAKAKHAAKEIALNISQGTVSLDKLSPDQQALCVKLIRAELTENELDDAIRWIRTTRRSAPISETIPNFITAQITSAKNKNKTPHIKQQQRDLENIAKHIGPHTLVSAITTKQLCTYIDSLQVGAKRHNGIRGTLTKYYSHLRTMGLIPNEPETAAHKIPIANEHRDAEIRVYRPEETTYILQHIKEEFLPWAALMAFSGLRPEEVSPKKGTPKPPLTTAALDFQRDTIWVKRSHAKGKKPRPRSMPMLPVCKAWLIHLGLNQGPERPICLRNPAEATETKRLGKLMNAHFQRTEGWAKDALRHAYGSYRNTLIKNLPRLSEEMGNSVTILHQHYHEPQPTLAAETHFQLTPKNVLKCSEITATTKEL